MMLAILTRWCQSPSLFFSFSNKFFYGPAKAACTILVHSLEDEKNASYFEDSGAKKCCDTTSRGDFIRKLCLWSF
jgi:hypothetical protein